MFFHDLNPTSLTFKGFFSQAILELPNERVGYITDMVNRNCSLDRIEQGYEYRVLLRAIFLSPITLTVIDKQTLSINKGFRGLLITSNDE